MLELYEFFMSRDNSNSSILNKNPIQSNSASLSKKQTAKSYSKLSELRLLTIGLASPTKIRQWAEKTLPNGKIFGQVTSPNTLHHKTFKPQRGGLFCERIFGPLKDFECACEKSSRPTEEQRKRFLEARKFERRFCPDCDVEYTWSVIRRYQLGYISLVAPVTHLWYLKATPSYLSILLDFKKRHLESIIYCSQTLTLQNSCNAFYNYTMANSPHTLIRSWKKVLTNISTPTFQTPLLNEYDVRKIERKKQINYLTPQRLTKWRLVPQQEKMENHFAQINGHAVHSATKTLIRPRFFDWENFQQISITSSEANLTISNYIYKRLQKLSYQRSIFLTLNKLMQGFFLTFYKNSSKSVKKLLWEIWQQPASQEQQKQVILELTKEQKIGKIKSKRSEIDMSGVVKTGVVKTQFESFYQTSIYKMRQDLMFETLLSSSEAKKYQKLFHLVQVYLIKNFIKSLSNKKELFLPLNRAFNSNLSLTQNTYVKSQALMRKAITLKKDLFVLLNRDVISTLFVKQFENFLQSLEISEIVGVKNQRQENFTVSVTENILTSSLNRVFFPHVIRTRNPFPMKQEFKKTETTRINWRLKTNSSFEDWTKYKEEFFKYLDLKNSKVPFITQTRNGVEKSDPKMLQNSGVTPVKKHSRLFNNMYVLSHRYRWELDKDWSCFLYYNYAAVEYADHSIFAYQDRVERNNTNSFAGAGVIQKLLQELDFDELRKIDKQNRILLYDFHKNLANLKNLGKRGVLTREDRKEYKELLKKRDQLMRRTKLIRKLFRKNARPEWMTLSVLPVLPPELRPIIKVQDQIAASDLNRLYQRVLYRNERLRKFLRDPATSYSSEMKYAQCLLQEAVDNLIENGKGGTKPERDSRGRNLKSLSEILKGKQGRFRQHLLGKRVDYSGRSVIVVSPTLKIHECGLPKEMALELFLPFLIQRILHLNFAKTVIGAKNFISTQKEFTFEILKDLLQGHPILLNRAPTLHRLGIQAFQPKLIEGRAILLHPLVCSAFNADFDGDQMAVHIPITVEARTEAWKLMFARNHLLSPATGEPMLLPSQDMVLGCYYLTSENSKSLNLFLPPVFSNFMQVFQAYNLGKIPLQMPIWVKWLKNFETGLEKEEPIEIRIDRLGNRFEIFSKYQRGFNQNGEQISQFIRTTPGRILLHLLMEESKKN
jgi:DNA-directed RNA polymerase beta' subunit